MTPAGNEIFVRRQYFKLVNHPTLLEGLSSPSAFRLNDGETVKSGERVEAVITIEAKNNYEYLLVRRSETGRSGSGADSQRRECIREGTQVWRA